MTTQTTALDNPYWDAVQGLVTEDNLWGGPVVDGYPLSARRPIVERTKLVKRYSWTITDPDTVAFVAEHSLGRLVDPLAGTGYWGWLLGQVGVDVISYDAAPGTNHWHNGEALHTLVSQLDGADAAALHSDRTLLLSWPPYDDLVGARVLDAYAGDRVIYIGEGEGGCCGDDDMFAAFGRDWVEVFEYRPIQWQGMHDYVTVYDRKAAS